MKKKIKYIVISSVLAILGIVYAVFYILYPEATKSTTALVFDYICSKPLPVIGITILALTIAVIRIIAVTSVGRKALAECRKDLEEAKKDRESAKQELLEFKQKIENEIADFKANHSDKMREICSNIPNKNVRELGEKFYGREEENSESITD